ncbi:polymorphic toxin-type HINT domain-containing protein [Bowmanella denitrificans]|uniref:polymorphic toxin-type HINT domain-containing protein n=1 Tax=Bowmanella denitrificans TaxID=366582 RepID=UPI0015595699|nr:polymorphic toxin-type HINT domain-containing protein [Bowmanella denitrificans]
MFSSSFHSNADDFFLESTLIDRMKKSYEVTPYSPDFLGDKVDLASGTLKFENVDVSIPGNFNIPVEFRREYNVSVGQNSAEYSLNEEMAGWRLSVPEITIQLAAAATDRSEDHYFLPTGFSTNKECSGDIIPRRIEIIPYPKGQTTRNFIAAEAYSSGFSLNIPGLLNTKLIGTKRTNEDPDGLRPIDDIRFFTDSMWRVSCIAQSDGTGEGYLAESPQGTKYYFDVVTVDYERPLDHSGNISHAIYHFKASTIEDRFGNWVKYVYSNQGKQLNKIHSSDLRQIDIAYDQGKVSTVTANEKIWTYNYVNNKLDSVTLPGEKRFWKYNLSKIMNDDITQSYFNKPWQCSTDKLYPSKGSLPAMQVTHPNGLVGTFALDWKIHGKTEVDANPHPDSFTVGDIRTTGDRIGNRRCSYIISLIEKRFSSGEYWNYSYSENHGRYSGSEYISLSDSEDRLRAVEYSGLLPEMQLSGSNLPENISGNSADYKYTKLKLKNGSYIKYFFNRNTNSPNYEQLMAEQHFTGSEVLQKEVLNEYKFINIGAGIAVPQIDASYAGRVVLNSGIKNYIYDTVDANVKDSFEIKISERDSYLFPTLTEENGTSGKRYTKRSYLHDTDKWVVGLPKGIYTSVSNQFSSTADVYYTYYTTGQYAGLNLLAEEKRHGQWVKKFKIYHDDGNVKRVEYSAPLKDSAGNNTDSYRYKELNDFYRGIPREEIFSPRYAGGISPKIIADVNWYGLIERTKDANDAVINYRYDEEGRIRLVDREDNFLDSVYVWVDEVTRVSTGLPPNRIMYQCSVDINAGECINDTIVNERTEYFDHLLRLKGVKETDVTANLVRNKAYSYNQLGLKTYESYWYDTNALGGTHYLFDSIGRLRRQYLSNDNSIEQKYDYLAGNKIKVTDAEKNVTTTTYQAYGSPAYDQAVKIESPESVTTDIDINIFGNINSITQSGKGANNSTVSHTEARRYNAQQQLCLVIRGDVGTTAYQYNDLGEMTLQAQGVTPGNVGCGFSYTNESKQKVEFVYDNLGDLWKVNYADANTPDITYTRDGNGNVLMLKAGTVRQEYHYNSLNLLDDETLTVDGKRIAASATAFSLDYTYDSLGNVKSLTYPDGDVISFAPNAFGQPTQAVGKRAGRTTDFTYASNAVYYPNGSIDSFNYGNGYQHKTTLNTRNVPSDLEDFKGTTHALRYGYLYDNNLNITKLTDGVHPTFSLTSLTYDGLDRLTSTDGADDIGKSSISYDGLGNILSYSSKDRNLTYKYDTASNRLSSVAGMTGKYSTFAYDDRGNIYNNGAKTFTYNRANQLVSSNSSFSYLYDGHNRRVKQTDSKGTSYSLYSLDGTLLYRETDQGGINYIYLGKKLIAKDGVIPEDSGTQHYRPYGESIEGAIDDVGYTGHKFDTDLGLSYMQARYYDPVIGRFYSNDPVGYTASNPVMSFNRYLYVNNNPYKYTDPNGEFLDAILDIGFIAYDLYDMATNGVNATNSASLTANVAGLMIPGATGLGLGVRAGDKGVDAANALRRTCCFVAGTQVLTEDGYKNIEDVKLGEKLWAKNTETGEQDWKPVTKVFIEPDRGIFEIKLVAGDGFEQKIQATDDHPFYVIGKGWKQTIELKVGDKIETDGNGAMEVVSVIDEQRLDLTYNFTVADFHTYYVTKKNVLVHNCNLELKPGGLGNSTKGSDDKVKNTVIDIINSGDKKAMECASCKLGESLKTRRADQKRQTNKRNKTYQDHKNRIDLEQDLKDKLDRYLEIK